MGGAGGNSVNDACVDGDGVWTLWLASWGWVGKGTLQSEKCKQEKKKQRKIQIKRNKWNIT